ncbi:hypothetical protein F5141DRAFT_1065817 [Pisolithus sp. B1]|nr:hypothetical protein F5141DRAFT_1065817 [Pisolithus sp. B1]
MWNMEDHGEREPLVNTGVAVNVIASSKDGKSIVTGDMGGKVVIWDTSLQQRCEVAERHGRMITALDVSSLYIASGSDDGTIRVWKMGEPEFLPSPGPLMRHSSVRISSVKFSPAGSHIASACAHWDCSVKVWHTRTGNQITSVRIDSSPTHSLAWSSDGRRLFAGCSNGSISCFNTFNQKLSKPPDERWTSGISVIPLRTNPFASYRRCVSASISPDDLCLASSGDDTKLSIRNLSKIVEASYFFHRLAPFPSHSEPFTYISPAAHRAWQLGELEQVEHLLSSEIEDERYPTFARYARANRALVRMRRGNLSGALGDAGEIMTNGAPILPIAYIAKGMALMGQGQRMEAIDTFGFVHHGDAKDFVEYVESLTSFEIELRDKSKCGTELAELSPLADVCSCPWVEARKLLLLAEHHLRRRKYNEGLRLLAAVPDLGQYLRLPEGKILPLIFGWDIYDLQSMVQQRMCQALFTSGRTQEVTDLIQVNDNRLDEESEARKADLGWLAEKLGDAAMRHNNYDDAITWYTLSSNLCPESRVDDRGSAMADAAITEDLALMACYPPGSSRLLVKRSKAKALKGFWDEALKDADQAIKTDKLCQWGYERRYVALHALQRYREATETLDEMITKAEESAAPSIGQLRTKYRMTTKMIDDRIDATRKISPFVLIDVRTGHLCNAAERIQMFKKDAVFYELVSSMELDSNHIGEVVARYFRYVMFSHTWEGKDEPTFQDVSRKPVYESDPHPLRYKLRCFCERVREDPEGYLWAWSDTCCIDKTIPSVYAESIRSMYSWYRKSVLTIVLLARESSPPTLKSNRWMTRAWTLQELLAPKSIRFYDRDWNLYWGDTRPNHKQSPRIMQELADAIDIAQDALVDFSPESLGIRAKLRLASTRQATKEVDIAYALIGIFSSDLIPEFREPEDALGLLLEGILHRDLDAKAVLDWVGKSSQFNTCLPAEISAYQGSPYTPSSIPENEIESRVSELRTMLPQYDVTTFFEELSNLGSIVFTHRRLSLPCITFPVSIDTTSYAESSSVSGQGIVYQGQTVILGQHKLNISCTTLMAQDKIVLVYPWIHDLLSQINRPEWDDYTRALRLVVHLEQPFRALLLVKQPAASTYKRVAADQELLVSLRKVVSLKDIVLARLAFSSRVIEPLFMAGVTATAVSLDCVSLYSSAQILELVAWRAKKLVVDEALGSDAAPTFILRSMTGNTNLDETQDSMSRFLRQSHFAMDAQHTCVLHLHSRLPAVCPLLEKSSRLDGYDTFFVGRHQRVLGGKRVVFYCHFLDKLLANRAFLEGKVRKEERWDSKANPTGTPCTG